MILCHCCAVHDDGHEAVCSDAACCARVALMDSEQVRSEKHEA